MTIVGVTHAYDGERPLFAPLTHTFAPGRVTGLVGPSGCGKSTLLAILAGMVTPSEGRVQQSGRCVWVFQNPYGDARRSALDHVSLPLLARGRSRSHADEEARALLRAFGLEQRASARFAALSGGEAQRLMLARATAAAPDLLLVDEPTAQLDRHSAEQVNGVIGELARGGATVVVATHDSGTRDACDELIGLGPT